MPARPATSGSSAGTSRSGSPMSIRTSSDVKNLNKYADLFKTSESGDKGQFLGTDPSYVQYDEALVENLGLNFKVIFTGSETATIEAIKQAVAQKKPLLFYWWDPHWLNSQVELTRDQAPGLHDGLRCGQGEGRLRLPGDAAQQDHQHQVQHQRR